MNAHDIATDLYFEAKGGEGGTVAKDGEALPTSGYFVGGKHPSLIFKSFQDVDRGELAWWVGTHSAAFYGAWVDSADGRVYFDTVTHVTNRDAAMTLAKVRNEIAIWDIANAAELRRVTDDQK